MSSEPRNVRAAANALGPRRNGGCPIELSENHDNYLLPFGLSLSKPSAHPDLPFDGLRANGDVVMIYGSINRTSWPERVVA
jgi:hypothetical protein